MIQMRLHISDIREGKDEFVLTSFPEDLELSYSGAEFTAPVKAMVSSDRLGLELTLSAKVQTIIKLCCARCLKEFDYEFASTFIAQIKLQRGGPHFADFLDEDFAFLDNTEGLIDLAERIREEVILELPRAPLCSPDCPGINASGKKEDIIDDRWKALQNLQTKVKSNRG